MNATHTEDRLAERLRHLRQSRPWSLDELARRSGVSRATLSRIEAGDVSPTTAVLARLCAAHGLTMSRLLRMVEDRFQPLYPRHAQPTWSDPALPFQRRAVSPPAAELAAEVIEGQIGPGTRIDYEPPARPGPALPGLEHHLILLDGALHLSVDGVTHALGPGDCLRYLLTGPTTFTTPAETGARYLLIMV